MRFLKSAMRRLLALVLLPFSWLRARFRPGIRILMYHRVDRLPGYDQLTVSPGRFDEHMAYLARHCRVIGLAEAVAELRAGGPSRPAVVVTFDDGYRDNLAHALPVLRRYRIPATIFVTTDFCDQHRRHPRYGDGDGRLHLDWQEVRELARDPLIAIGSHTLTHPYLPRTLESQAREEIIASRDRIARETGSPVDFFCYPSGDFGMREVALANEAGYSAAVTVAPGVNGVGAGLYLLRRTEMTDNDSTFDLFAKLNGAYDGIHAWLHWRRERRFGRAAKAATTQTLREGKT